MSRAMRDSGIPWIGEIPQEWKVVRTKNVFTLGKDIVGRDSANTQLLSLTTKGVKMVQEGNTSGKVPTSYDTYQVVHKNNIVFCLFDLDCSAVFSGVSDYEGVISPAYKVVSLQNGYTPRFYDYWFTYIFDGRKYKYLSKNIRYSLTYDEFAALGIVAPPLSEQKAIADFLDGKCAEIDEAVVVQEQMIDELRAYKQSVIAEAVTHGLNPDAPMRDSGIPWIGQIPQAWDMVRFKTESKFINGYAFESDEFRLYNGVSVIRIGDIQSNIEYEKCAKVDSRQYLEDYKVCDKDILIAMSGATTGKCCLVETAEYAYINQRVGIIRGQNYKYLYYSLLSAGFAEYISLFNAGSAQPNISSKAIGNFILCKPENDECCKIVNYLDKKCTEIDELIAIKQQKIEALKEYKKSIIYEYVTGKKEVRYE